jgi:hypothetical protein
MFNPSSGVWFWDGTIALTGELSHLRILILVFFWVPVGLDHIPWIWFLPWLLMIYCWIESHPVNWVFPVISRDLLNWNFPVIYNWIKSCPVNWVLPLDFPWFMLDWITSCELGFSLDFQWFTVELNHIPWIGFFPWFPMIYCWIESHAVNWVFPNDFPWFTVGLNHIPWIAFFLQFPVGLNHILHIGFFPLISRDLLLNWITSHE